MKFKKIVKDEENLTLTSLSEEGSDIAAEEEFNMDKDTKGYLTYKKDVDTAIAMLENGTAIEVIPTKNVVARAEYTIDVFLPVLTSDFPCEEKDIFKPSVYLTEEKANEMVNIITEALLKPLKEIKEQLNQPNEKEAIDFYKRNIKFDNFKFLFNRVINDLRKNNSFYQECLEEYKQVRDPLLGEANQQSKKEAEEYKQGEEQREYEYNQRQTKEKLEKMNKETEEIRNKQKETYTYPEMDLSDKTFVDIDYERGHSEEDKVVYYWPVFKKAPFDKGNLTFDHIYTSEDEAIHALNLFKDYYEFSIKTFENHTPKLTLEKLLNETKRLFDLDSFNVKLSNQKKQNSSRNIKVAYEVNMKKQFKDFSLQQLDSIAYKFDCHVWYLDLNDSEAYYNKYKKEIEDAVHGYIGLTGLKKDINDFLKEVCFDSTEVPNSVVSRESAKGNAQYKEAEYGYPMAEEQTLYTEKINQLENDPQALIYALSDYTPTNMYAAYMNRDGDKETFAPSFLRKPFVNAFKALDKATQKNLFFKNEENAWDILNDFLKYCFQDETLKNMLTDLEELTSPIKQTASGNDKEKTQKEKDKNAKSTKIKKLKEAAGKIIPEKAKEFFNLDTTKKKIEDDHASIADLYKLDEPKIYLIGGKYPHVISLPKIVDGVKKNINITPKRELIQMIPNKNVANKNNNAPYGKMILTFVPDVKIYPLLCELYDQNPDDFNWDSLYNDYYEKYKTWFEGIVFTEIKEDILDFREKFGIIKWNEMKSTTEVDNAIKQYKDESEVFKQFSKICEPIKLDEQGNEMYNEVITKDLHGRDVVNYVPALNEDVELNDDTVLDYYDSIDFTFTNQENEDFSYDRDTIQNLADTHKVKLISYEELNPFDLDDPDKVKDLDEETLAKMKELDEKDAGLSVFYQVKGKGKNMLDFIYSLTRIIPSGVKYKIDLPIIVDENTKEDLTYTPYITDKNKLERSIKANLKNYLELGYLSYKDRLYKYS